MSILSGFLTEQRFFHKVINLIQQVIHRFTHRRCEYIKNIMPPKNQGVTLSYEFILNDKGISVNKYKISKN